MKCIPLAGNEYIIHVIYDLVFPTVITHWIALQQLASRNGFVATRNKSLEKGSLVSRAFSKQEEEL